MTRQLPPDILIRMQQHKDWLETFKKEGQQFAQQWADLSDLDLSGHDLAWVALSHVRLDRALLYRANLNSEKQTWIYTQFSYSSHLAQLYSAYPMSTDE